MSYIDWYQIVIFFSFFLVTILVLGKFIAAIFQERKTFLTPVLGWLENTTYYIAGINPYQEMRWGQYAKSLVLFSCWGIVFMFLMQQVQYYLPFNPNRLTATPGLLALNTGVSFTTNTDLQDYIGENTYSYAVQMWGLTAQNFMSAAGGMAVLMALIRGITRKTIDTIGNFWVDVVRIVIYLLLPLSLLFALVLVSQGVVQSLSPNTMAITLEKEKQTIPLGPVASQEAIKQLGSNGAGFFNANSAHPFENPTPFSNFLEMLAIVAIPAATVYAYGLIVKSKKHAWTLLGTMFGFCFLGFGLIMGLTYYYSPSLEGVETRFGLKNSLLWSSLTTATSNGSVNAMLEGFVPIVKGVLLANMLIGETIFGGVGVGLCNMLLFVFLTVILCGLLVGHTPVYFGKKFDKNDIQWVMIGVFGPCVVILLAAVLTCLLPSSVSGITQTGPHVFTELVYATASATSNNGSILTGVMFQSDYFYFLFGLAMLLGRMCILFSCLGLAGSLAAKKSVPYSLGILSASTVLFAVLLGSVMITVAALMYFPLFALGPILEHFMMLSEKTVVVGA